MEIDTWTTRHAVQLRAAYRAVHPEFSDERFARDVLGVAQRTLYHWQNAAEKPLRPDMQGVVKAFYGRASAKVRATFTELLTGSAAGASVRVGHGLVYASSLGETLAVLGGLGHDGGHHPGSLDTVTQAALDWLVTPPHVEGAASRRTVDADEVAEIRQMTVALDSLERTIGGDYCRATAVEYLRRVLPRLSATAPESVRRDLFSATAALCELIGWMAYDANEHGLAQSYFVQGLRLARESGDIAYGAYILSTMSHQALYLKSPKHALRLARLAVDQAARVANPTVQTEALVLEARAHAALGDGRAGPEALARAEQAFRRPLPSDLPEWSHAWSDVLFASHVGTSWVELGKPDEAEQAFALVWDSAKGQPRRRVYSGVYLAHAALIRRDLDTATGYVREILPGLTGTASHRSRTEVRGLLTVLTEYSAVGDVRDVVDEVRFAIGDNPPTA